MKTARPNATENRGRPSVHPAARPDPDDPLHHTAHTYGQAGEAMPASTVPAGPPPATSSSSRQKRVGYRLDDADAGGGVLWLVEDPTLVLLGGEVWPSAFAMAEFLESRLLRDTSTPPGVIVELGAGAGLCALVAAATILRRAGGGSSDGGACRVFLTDESPELAAVNAALFREAWLGGSDGGHAAPVSVEALDLPWGDSDSSALPPPLAAALDSSPSSSGPLLVLGCEVTPMAKTQPALVATLRALLHHHQASRTAAATALLTVDACTLLPVGSGSSSPEYSYPRVCPAAAAAATPCAGHRFLALIEAEENDLEWAVERVWTAEEARAASRERRVREGGGAAADVDFGAVTAPEGLVLVSVRRRRRRRGGEDGEGV